MDNMSQLVQTANDAAVAVAAIINIGATCATAIPVLGTVISVAKTCKQIYDVTSTSKKNKENCKKVSKRCRAILLVLTECAQAYQRNGKISQGQERGLNDLFDALEELQTNCEKYIGLGKTRRILSGDKFKKNYERIDKEIDGAMKRIQIGLSTEILNRNNQLL